MPGSIVEWQIKENIDIDDFELTDAEMAEINALDRGQRFFNMPIEQLEQFVFGGPVQ